MRTEEALRSVATNRYNPPTTAAGLGAGAESSVVAAADGSAASATAAAAVVATSMSLSSTASTATIAGAGTVLDGGAGVGSSWLDEVGPDGRRRRRSKKQVETPQPTCIAHGSYLVHVVVTLSDYCFPTLWTL